VVRRAHHERLAERDVALLLHRSAPPHPRVRFQRVDPVGHVLRIRCFDDVAIIHAENDYELKDGRTGISRYTDIWVKQIDDAWKCVAAHITVFRAPT
jgi:hypothetical protein